MAFKRLALFSCLVSLLSACQPNQDPPMAGTCTPTSETPTSNAKPLIMIGDNDWVDYRQTGDDPQNINELTVAQVKIPAMMATCTGFLINEDTVMTNNHCIGSASSAANVTAIFRDENGVRTTYSCGQFIMTDSGNDFTLVKCSNAPGRKFGWVGLSDVRPTVGDPIYVVQENCDYFTDPHCTINKYVALGEVLQSQLTRIFHDADTLGGSSGSPIFSDITHQVIALHNAGSPATMSSPDMNAGVPMFQILTKIKSLGTVTTYKYGSSGTGLGGGSGTGSGSGNGSGNGSGTGSGSGNGSGYGSGTGSDGIGDANISPITNCTP